MTPRPPKGKPELLTLNETADILRCCKRTVSRLIAGDQLAATRVGRSVRVTRRELERFLRP